MAESESGREPDADVAGDPFSNATAHDEPGPSFWPLVLAVGIAMALIGVITQYVVVAIGLAITLVALVGWVRSARKDYRALP